jgi:hypothetical protein
MGTTHDLSTERLVLEQFLDEPRWSRAALKVQLEHVDPQAIDGALAGLVVVGVVIPDGRQFQVAPCVAHLDTLGRLAPAARNGSSPDAATLDRVLARQALEAYARRSAETAGNTEMIGELAPLVDRARRAGLDTNAIASCIGQPTLEGA